MAGQDSWTTKQLKALKEVSCLLSRLHYSKYERNKHYQIDIGVLSTMYCVFLEVYDIFKQTTKWWNE